MNAGDDDEDDIGPFALAGEVRLLLEDEDEDEDADADADADADEDEDEDEEEELRDTVERLGF